MTIGFAATYLGGGAAAFALAADSRYSFADGHSDMAVKTYAFGPRAGLVTAGNALSCGAAADLQAPAGVNVIIRPGDLSWFVDGAEPA